MISSEAWGLCQVEPRHSISRLRDGQGCFSQIRCWQFFFSVQVFLPQYWNWTHWPNKVENSFQRQSEKFFSKAEDWESILPSEQRQLQLFLPLVSSSKYFCYHSSCLLYISYLLLPALFLTFFLLNPSIFLYLFNYSQAKNEKQKKNQYAHYFFFSQTKLLTRWRVNTQNIQWKLYKATLKISLVQIHLWFTF